MNILDSHLSSKQIFLSSNDAYKHITSGEKIFVFNDPIQAPSNIEMSLSLSSVAFCNSQYTINSKNNLILLKFSSGTPEVQITIPDGFYSANRFVIGFQAELDSTFGANQFAVTYNNINGRFTLDGPNNFTGVFLSGSGNLKTNCFEPLGYPRDDVSVLTDSNGKLIMPQVADFSGLNSVYFEMMNLNSSCLDSRGHNSSTLARINVTKNPGGYVYFNNESNSRFRIYSKTINVFHIKLTDRYSQTIDFNSVPWECSLVVDFNKVREIDLPLTVTEAIEKSLITTEVKQEKKTEEGA